jgi:hypothetical protein
VDLPPTLAQASGRIAGPINSGLEAPLPVEPTPFSLATPPLFTALAPARRILIAGAGGGFDIYAGLPLALALWHSGAQVHLANLSFSELELIDSDSWVARDVAAVTPDTTSPDWYFPERALVQWLAAQGLPATVYAFPPLGVQTLRAAYQHLIERLDIDAVVRSTATPSLTLRPPHPNGRALSTARSPRPPGAHLEMSSSPGAPAAQRYSSTR